MNFGVSDTLQSKFDCSDGSKVNGIRQPFLYSFELDKPTDYKEVKKCFVIHCKGIHNPILNTITFRGGWGS